MRHRPFAVLFLALAALAGACAHSDPPVGPVVDDLTIEGNEAVSDSDIKGQIATGETGWLPWSAKRRLDANVWSTDLRRIERYYRARGFYQAQVLGAEVVPSGKDEVKIRVRVVEGEPTRLSGVSLTGLDELPERHRRQVQRRLTLREGDVFLESQWASLRDALAQELVSLGYAAAEVVGSAQVDLATRQARVELKADPGMRYRPGPVQVEVQPGARVEAWRIEEQVREAVEDEDWFSREMLEESQQRVFGMGVFGAAQVTPLAPDPQSGTVPLRVEATEAPFHELALGFGIGIEQRRQEGHLIGEYSDRDFLGTLRQLTLEARVGWAFIPSTLTALRGGDAVTQHGPIARLDALMEQPRLFHPNFRARVSTRLERAVEPAFSFTGGRARLGVPWRPFSWLEVEPSYNIEIYRLSAGQTELAGDAPALLFGCEGTCVLSYLEQRLVFDRRDDPQEPRSGYYLALALQEGGGPLGGSFDYLRVVPELRGYTSFLPGKRLTLAGRVRVGSLFPLGTTRGDLDTPVVARFFSGGDGHRGFSTQRLSPMRLVQKDETGGEFSGEPVPIGGNGLFEASFETRYSLSRALVGALFVDTGFVTTEHVRGLRQFSPRNLLWAVGAGLRYRTPVGPVRVDIAYRLPVGPALPIFQPAGEPLSFAPAGGCFGFGGGAAGRGGAPEGVCSFHLSIGEAF